MMTTLPLIALNVLYYAAVAAGSLIGGGYLVKKTGLFNKNKKEEISLAVLGLKGSGKTTLQNYFRNKHVGKKLLDGATPFAGMMTEEVNIKKGKKKIKIISGMDVSGSDEAIIHQYDKQIEDNDHILYIFNASKLDDEVYHKDCRGLLNKIKKKVEKEQEEGYEKRIILIGSHRDLIKTKKFGDEDIIKYFDGLISKEPIVFCANLTSTKDLEKIQDSLFK